MSESSNKSDSPTKLILDGAATTPVDNSLLELSRELGLLAGKRLATLETPEMMSGTQRESKQ